MSRQIHRVGTGRRRVAVVMALCVLLLAVQAGDGRTAQAEDADKPQDGFTVVPQIFDLRLGAARARLRAAGLRVRSPLYEMSWRRALDRWLKNVPIGTVIAQAPEPGTRVPRGKQISLIVSAVRDGVLPKNLPPASPLARGELGSEQRKQNDGQSVPDPVGPKTAPAEQPVAPAPDAPQPSAPAPDRPAPDQAAAPAPGPLTTPDRPVEPGDERDQPKAPATNPRAPTGTSPDALRTDDTTTDAAIADTPNEDDPAIATGSPEAPRPAPKPNPDIVPPLMGLDLAVAEQLCRDAKMTLYVERVAGHPVGRVLEQTPEAYEPRGPGGVVKVIVTAGGDYTARMAPPAEVHVDEVDVPDVHDRTGPQAIRILRDLRLVGQVLPTTRGTPGRVTNQDPLPGKRLRVGGLVKVYIPPAAVTQPTPIQPKPIQPTTPVAPTPTPPQTPVAGAPQPVAPAGGTPMDKTESVTIAFMWRAVPGATAYVLEVEEQGAGTIWMQSVRKPVRKTAAVVEVERLDTATARALRWRVRAVVNGRQTDPSQWVVLR